ncbi:MAG TPA: hypothetical protein VN937_02285 [Blastocatellia bacterium]|nr:hypothetical protein [Blastocatellia bacterium]
MKKASRYLIFVLSVTLLTTSVAGAFDGPRADKDRDVATTASTPEPSARKPVAGQPVSVSYKLYESALDPEASLASVATRPRTVSPKAANTPAPPPPAPPPVSTAPMTAGEKFKLFAQKSFLSPGAYAMSVVSGVYGEWTDDKNNHHHANPGDFAADSMTRAARSFTFRANANFFEKFMFASLFKQDPRYHRSGRKGAGAKIAYAVSRIFITQGDRNGKDEFNASFIAGGLAASGMANLWEREERQDLHHFATRFGSHVALTALTNILREFIGGQ